ncbi:hypothetical protein DL89DRAFT_59470 [Linderina pennispora]|uniref:Uncharacterized protein n=1 Tax=Linderina pennispora TaxID=61395 RepID=A0A1Y1W0W4_9FUNG|nr:uncharacterized protein DL89DRAFT_59470 [Linderina pennispora]ORX66764.1 hypothetical protein DL89DRAFT_59470 [Linderina pennispora]
MYMVQTCRPFLTSFRMRVPCKAIDTRVFDLTPYHIEIVQRNAPVLQRLRVVLDRPETFRQLVLRGDGMPIVFPCLRTLKMNSPESTAAAQSSVDASPSGAIFPELELLYLNMRYPFENDVLFRGNKNSLRLPENTGFRTNSQYACPL